MEAENSLLYDVEAYVTNFITEQVPKVYAYHDINHTLNVVSSTEFLCKEENLDDKSTELLLLAAWFHDTGYDKGPQNHEIRSCRYAHAYLKQHGYAESDIEIIEGCIMATQMPQQPQNRLQQILCDADFSHLGQKGYWEYCNKVRDELAQTRDITMSEETWIDFEIDFISKHSYFTPAAKECFAKKKAKHLWQLIQQQTRFENNAVLTVDQMVQRDKKPAKKKKKKKVVVEKPAEKKTIDLPPVFHQAYSTNWQMDKAADRKAHFLMGLCVAIILVITGLYFSQAESLYMIPSSILLFGSLVTIYFAAAVTRPTSLTEETSGNPITHLLFNRLHNQLDLSSFRQLLNQQLQQQTDIFELLTADIHQKSKMVARKYRKLHLSYNFFLASLILSVLLYGIITLFK